MCDYVCYFRLCMRAVEESLFESICLVYGPLFLHRRSLLLQHQALVASGA